MVAIPSLTKTDTLDAFDRRLTDESLSPQDAAAYVKCCEASMIDALVPGF
ncbi:hypothetical protein X759_36735 [Mesorhizobium sp. LSHC420B00]|nr:hypothetical protein X759_36735 [Mesorhizobium sp. LSHC420B00]